MRTMVNSGRGAGNCTPGDRFLCCRRWEDPKEDFEEVVVRGRRGPYVSVELLSGPDTGETINVRASSLWTADQLDYASERRARDLRIAELDRESPVDSASELAMEALCVLVTGDSDVRSQETLEVVLAQLGRPVELNELHELAYAIDEPFASVTAPAVSWHLLFEELARSQPGVVEEGAAKAMAGWSWVSDGEKAQALARLRTWAGLPPLATPLELKPVSVERNEGKRAQQAITSAAAALLESADLQNAPGASLKQAFREYRSAREELGQPELSASKGFKASRRVSHFAEELCGFCEDAARPLMSWLLEAVGVRGYMCDHIVWSDYSAQHPRTLHLFPDGHLFPEEEGVSRNHPGTLTACGQQISLRWSGGRSWYRAGRGDWLEYHDALIQYREKVARHEAAEEALPYRYFDPDYDQARRICERCAAFHGLFLECLESRDVSSRWPPWQMAEIREQAHFALRDQLRENRPVGTLERAQRIALEAWLAVELGVTARELRRRGPGPLRRLFGERSNGSPSRYEQWSAICEPVGLEPHELLSQPLWEKVLRRSLGLFDPAGTWSADRRPRDEIRDVLEARMADLS
jgi:hypothetical protein